MASQDRSLNLARALLWALVALFGGYSLAYVGGVRVGEALNECSRQLQTSQLPGNFGIAIAAALGAMGIGRKRRWGLTMAAAAASAAAYIGLLDITYNIRNEVYAMPWRQIAPELFANSVCILVPAYLFFRALTAPVWD